MAFTLFKWIYISPLEKKIFNPFMLRFLRLHEEYHAKKWWRTATQKDELEATQHAFKTMLAEGYKFKDLLRMELDYRIFQKYGVRLSEFIRLMGGGKK